MRVRGPLATPPFRAIWLSGLVSDSGDWLLFIALPLVVLERSGSAFGTSLAFLLELVPGVLLTPVAAWCADRLDPRRFLGTIAVTQAVTLTPLLAVDSVTRPGAALAIVYGVIVVEAALTALSDPARNALLPRLVPAAELVLANSLIGLAQNVARLVGGPLGGVVLTLDGLTTVALADLASYLIAALLIARVTTTPATTTPATTAPAGTTADHTAEAARPERSRRAMTAVLRVASARRLLVITFGCQVAQGMFVVLFVLFVVRGLHGGPGDVGLLRGIQAVGAIAAALAVATLARRASALTLIGWATVAFGTISLAVWNGPAVTTSLAVYVVLFALVGAPGVVLGTGLISGLQSDVPPALHGRAFALSGLASNAGLGLGIVYAGLLTAPLGLTTMLDIEACVYLLVGGATLLTTLRSSVGPGPRAPAARPRERRADRGSGDRLPVGSPSHAGS